MRISAITVWRLEGVARAEWATLEQASGMMNLWMLGAPVDHDLNDTLKSEDVSNGKSLASHLDLWHKGISLNPLIVGAIFSFVIDPIS
jgi:hypothetical protein